MIPPKPGGRHRRVSLWRYFHMFRRDILSAQPDHLFRAKMAEFRTPFFKSFLVNEPELVRRVLIEDWQNFPKSTRVTRGLEVLLGQSVFVTNGEQWARQRRIIDPAFEGGRVKAMFPSMVAAAEMAVGRVEAGDMDVEPLASHATADVIFRVLFSVPIEDNLAAETFVAFRAFQRTQPVAIASALLPWWPVRHRRETREAAERLRGLIEALVARRTSEIAAGAAPDDLATKLMVTPDPATGECFSPEEMVDQVTIFFLAGHETSASLLGWALWCLAAAPEWADKVREEAERFWIAPEFGALSKMPATRNVLREVLRLYPPVPMFVRETVEAREFRKRDLEKGSQVVVSPWHLGRHEALWENPDEFDPSRWEGDAPVREAWLPFSAGPRVCPGTGFAMAEAAVLLSALVRRWRFETLDEPVPVAHLTLRARDGIWLKVKQG